MSAQRRVVPYSEALLLARSLRQQAAEFTRLAEGADAPLGQRFLTQAQTLQDYAAMFDDLFNRDASIELVQP